MNEASLLQYSIDRWYKETVEYLSGDTDDIESLKNRALLLGNDVLIIELTLPDVLKNFGICKAIGLYHINNKVLSYELEITSKCLNYDCNFNWNCTKLTIVQEDDVELVDSAVKNLINDTKIMLETDLSANSVHFADFVVSKLDYPGTLIPSYIEHMQNLREHLDRDIFKGKTFVFDIWYSYDMRLNRLVAAMYDWFSNYDMKLEFKIFFYYADRKDNDNFMEDLIMRLSTIQVNDISGYKLYVPKGFKKRFIRSLGNYFGEIVVCL